MDVPKTELTPQSGVEQFNVSVSASSPRMQSETTAFTDQNPSYKYTVDSQPDSTYGSADMGDVSLANFLARPVKIQSINWATSSPDIYFRFNPWTDFFTDPRVANRIAHYSLMRCKLNLRVLVNGNSFHFGRAILSYIPMHEQDFLTKDRSWVQQDIIQASQRPHIYIDPTYSQGGEMEFPFFWNKNALSIPDDEYNAMGECVFHTINKLKHANGADDNVTINIFAWASDLTLSAPTTALATGLTPQSGIDEYGDGMISKPAGVVARIAGSLTSAPVIGPYARATQIASGALSGIASLFGYSRPNDISTIKAYKPTFLGNMANTNLEDTAIKLSLDAKQEITVDPRVTGLSNTDEMTVCSVVKRESYLTTFDWLVADPLDEKLWASDVTPVLWGNVGPADTPTTELHLPACAFGTLPFQYWRGTLNFRFQVVASNFHRGRLRVVYEPYGPTAALNYNENYNRVIDIAEEKDFTVSIGWGAQTSYAGFKRPGRVNPPYGKNHVTVPGPQGTSGPDNNGHLSLFVVNDLTVPNSTVDNDIQVNVFISAGDDFEVAAPWSVAIAPLTHFPPPPLVAQSGVEDVEQTSEPSAPMQTSTESMAAIIDTADPTTHVYFGEEIKSFRQCLKRYNYHHIVGPGVGAGEAWWKLRFPAFPYPRGGEPTAPVNGKYNYSRMTMLNYLVPAYTGWRGGLRWKSQYHPGVQDAAGADPTMGSLDLPFVARRSSFYSFPYENGVTARIWTGTPEDVAFNDQVGIPDTWEGASATSTRQNPVLETEVPYYLPYRFTPAKWSSSTQVSATLDQAKQSVLELTVGINEDLGSPVITNYVSTAEDFSTYFFTGSPVFYYNPTLPPSV